MPDLNEVNNSGGLAGVTNTALNGIASVLAAKYTADSTQAGYEQSAMLAANSSAQQEATRQQNMLYFGIGAFLLLAAIVAIKVTR